MIVSCIGNVQDCTVFERTVRYGKELYGTTLHWYMFHCTLCHIESLLTANMTSEKSFWSIIYSVQIAYKKSVKEMKKTKKTRMQQISKLQTIEL
jgi:hypothetical protein